MKVGDLVRWTEVEEVYHKFCPDSNTEDLTPHRKCGIIVDSNGIMFFVQWNNGDFLAQRPNSIEVISESR